MSTAQSSLWRIVLAGGEGVEQKEFIHDWIGAFVEASTMLERTVRRASLLIPSRGLVVSGTVHHCPYLFQILDNRLLGSVLLQPQNRGTVADILFPLIHILRAAPRAHVAIFPSDHFVCSGRRFIQSVRHAADYLRRTRSDFPIVLAAEATYPETDHAWIAPGVSVGSGKTGSIFHVKRFIHKPSFREAERMLTERYLWNTRVLVARGASLLERFRRARCHCWVRIASALCGQSYRADGYG